MPILGNGHERFPKLSPGRLPARQRARARRIDVQSEKDLGSAPPAEWRNEIDQTAIPGGFFGEIIFFHKVSKALILTDTIINLELDKIDQPWRLATRITGMYHPRGQLFFGMRLPLLLQRAKARAAMEKILSWHPHTIILSHGRCFETGADQIRVRLFYRALQEHRPEPE